MSDPELDRAADLLRATGRVTMTVGALAAALRTIAGPAGTANLIRRLREDPRFVVLDPAGDLPGTDTWTVAERAAYDPVLRQLQIPGQPLVVLRDPTPDPTPDPARDPRDPFRETRPPSLDRLLHRTLLGLVGLPAAPRLAAAAEEARAALDPVSQRRP
jgi:hypothetical protein